ncbi:MAG: hypothetical protein J5759_06095 [Bacteroidales bacterium]|nr:hypothetical protein [Bacteroidales bacterium]
MKKLFAFCIAALALLAVSCNKETAPVSGGTVVKTFSVTAPVSSKTELDGMNVLWSAGDEINVIAKESGNQYTFTLSEGAGSSSAKFSGTLLAEDAEETEFYAVYPNVAIRSASLSAATPLIEFDKTMGRQRLAVKDGFDPGQGVLTAVLDEGSFPFRHGSAYFKIDITEDNVDSIVVSTSNARFSGRPTYTLDGAYNSIEGAKNDVVLAPESGTLEKGTTYYIPVLCKNSTIKVLTLKAYFHDGKVSTLTTSQKESVKLALGKVYSLGSPNITTSPVLTLSKASIENIAAAAATGLTADEAYTLRNCTDSDVTVTVDGTVVTGASVEDGTITFDVSENTGSAREGWIGLQVPGSAVQKITVKQSAPGVKETHVWDFGSEEWQEYLNTNQSKVKDTSVDGYSWTAQLNGLTYKSGNKDKWSVDGYIQPNGRGTNTSRCFSFSVASAGKLTVTVTNPKNTEDTSSTRVVKVQNGGTTQTSTSVLYPDKVTREFTIAAGSVIIYPDGNGLRFWKIEFEGE